MHNNINNKEDFLKEIFGYDKFRYGQDKIIDSTINKENNLVIIPTGGGKSLIYQISGSILKNKNNGKGLSVVISPLISLMQDQVKELKERGINGITINSHSSNQEKRQIFNDLKEDKVDFLFLSPEKLSFTKMRSFLKSLNINLFVIDEAHCCSLWGHQFRPDYAKLGKYLEEINNKKSPIVSLTATANDKTISDIKEMIYEDKIVKTNIGGYYRENFNLKIIDSDANEEKKITDIVKNKVLNENKNGIIYFSTVKELQYYSNYIFKKEIQSGIAGSYHGKGSKEDRENIQKKFINGDLKFILATTAFGMGVNKSNIDFIIHSGFPGNIESYYQEIGRGGRDGRKVETFLLKQNIKTQLFFIEISYLTSDLLSDSLKYIKENYIDKNIDYIDNIFNVGVKSLGTDKYNNGLYSYLIRYDFISKEDNVFKINKKNLLNKSRNNEIFKEINEIKKIKEKNVLEMNEFFNLYSNHTLANFKKYQPNKNMILKSLDLGLYINILDYFNDKEGIEKLLENKSGNFDIKNISFSNKFELKDSLNRNKMKVLTKSLDILTNSNDDSFINDLLDDSDIDEINDDEKDKNKLIIDRMGLF